MNIFSSIFPALQPPTCLPIQDPLSLSSQNLVLSKRISELLSEGRKLKEENQTLKATISQLSHEFYYQPLRQISTHYPLFQFPILDTSFDCLENAADYLKGEIKNWSCQEALHMCSFLYSQAQPEKAKSLFFSHALSSFINEREVLERELALFLPNEDSLDSEDHLISINRKTVLVDLLKQMLFDNSSLVWRLPSEIFSWILKSEKNTSESLILQGYHHEKQTNDAEALKCYEEGAQLGSPLALVEIGNCYWDGRGVEQNDQKAFECYAKGADLDSALAFIKMGDCYWEGRGVEQNDRKAFECYTKGADLGSALAYARMGDCYLDGKGIQQNDQDAFTYYRQAAHLGSALAFVKIGDRYFEGAGVEQNDVKAFEFFQKGAELGSPIGFTIMGICYSYGRGVEQNDQQGFKHYQKGAQLGCAEGWFQIGNLYWEGKGVEQNNQQAFELFQKGAHLGSTRAFTALGVCYWVGRGAAKDDLLAVECLKKGDKQENFILAKSLSSDTSTIEDQSLAKTLLEQLISQNCPGAQEFYEDHYS